MTKNSFELADSLPAHRPVRVVGRNPTSQQSMTPIGVETVIMLWIVMKTQR